MNHQELYQRTFTDIVADGYDIHLPSAEIIDGLNTACAITGQRISRGYRISDVVAKTQGEWLETFGGNYDGYLSINTARLWGATNPKKDMRGSKSIAVFESSAYEPMISQKSADKQGRPSWSDLVRIAWKNHRGELCALSCTTETKKRVWWRGVSGELGHNTPVLLYDNSYAIHKVEYINWPEMLRDLTIVEEIYTCGFSKPKIHNSLYSDMKLIDKLGFQRVFGYEEQLSKIRRTSHFIFCLLIAQVNS